MRYRIPSDAVETETLCWRVSFMRIEVWFDIFTRMSGGSTSGQRLG
jgi:hypothetical protein